MGRSIRWSFLGWHSAILVVVLAGFGIAMYQLREQTLLGEVDRELAGAARALDAALRANPEPPWKSRRPRDEAREDANDPKRLLRRYGGEDATYHYVIRRKNGETYRASGGLDEIPTAVGVYGEATDQVVFRTRGEFREVGVRGPFGTEILVGRSLAGEEHELASLLGWILASAGGLLAIGIAGGWWISSRVVRPIAVMSRTAEMISAHSLDQRIDVRETKSELGNLADVLNHTFGRLQDSFERQARFTADASHELRTPLSVLLSRIELALAQERSDEEYRTALRSCGEAAQRLRGLVDGLLLLARADSEDVLAERRPLDLAAIAGEVTTDLAPLAAEHGVSIRVTRPEQGRENDVEGNPESIARVLFNLVENAIRYNHSGGWVEIILQPGELGAEIVVADSGPGIASEHRPRVFDRFYRLDDSRSRSARADGGAGLGLAICRGIVDAHGGSIELGAHEGGGAAFTVRLPRAS
tara:strand:- start:494 stop:1912 length:1419 start_codon:yes stop_codon:yes gene_type:complete